MVWMRTAFGVEVPFCFRKVIPSAGGSFVNVEPKNPGRARRITVGKLIKVCNDQRMTSGWIEGYCADRPRRCVFSVDACSGKRTAKIKPQCRSPRIMLCQKTKSGNPVSQRQGRESTGNVELDRKGQKESRPSEGAVSLYIIVLDGLFLRVCILILIFACNWSLTAALFHPGTLVIGLAVFWHNTHLVVSLPGKLYHIRRSGRRNGPMEKTPCFVARSFVLEYTGSKGVPFHV